MNGRFVAREGRSSLSSRCEHSANNSPVPSGTEWRWYLSLISLASDCFDGEARFPKFKNCWAQGLGSGVRGPRECQSIVALPGGD